MNTRLRNLAVLALGLALSSLAQAQNLPGSSNNPYNGPIHHYDRLHRSQDQDHKRHWRYPLLEEEQSAKVDSYSKIRGQQRGGHSSQHLAHIELHFRQWCCEKGLEAPSLLLADKRLKRYYETERNRKKTYHHK